ncbi:MAG: hypothetical protein HKM02_00125 [Pseudomonadales bacterium]|nr:hypothetical protein [Pseudomonadales bacterium]
MKFGRIFCEGILLTALAGCSHSPSKDHMAVNVHNHQGHAGSGGADGSMFPAAVGPRLLVLDFTTTDQLALRFLPPPNLPPVAVAPQVGMAPGAVSPRVMEQNNNWQQMSDDERQHYGLLDHEVLDTRQGRATVLGADMLTNDLAQFPGWTILNRDALRTETGARLDIKQLADVVKARKVDVLIYGTVEDLGVRSSDFHGYGVDTTAQHYFLHVLVKAVSTHDFRILASGEYSAEDQQSQDARSSSINTDSVRTMMQTALQEASNDLIVKLGPSGPSPTSANHP